MEIRCCMVGCDNVSSKDENNGNDAFFVFPKDFNLCMLWVQNCGRPEYFEDFAFAGAQPFLNRHICSKHFSDIDFIKKDPKLGILPGSIPNLNLAFQRVDVKEEIVDPGYSEAASGLAYSENELLNEIKLEKFENDNCEEINANFSFSSTDDSGNDVHGSPSTPGSIDVYKETKEDKELSNEFFKKYKTAIKGRGNTRRSYETEEERTLRLKKEALRAKIRRSQESEEQKKLRRMKNALRAAFRRQNETPDQRELRKRKDKLRSQTRRKAETETETRIRRYNDAVRAAFRRNNETQEQRMERKMKDIIRAAKRRSMETPEQRADRLRKDRERASKRRMLKRITEQMTRLDGLSELGQVPAPVKIDLENGFQPLTMSSIGTIATRCNEASNMDHLQQVLEFIENNTSKSNKRTLKEPPEINHLDKVPHTAFESTEVGKERTKSDAVSNGNYQSSKKMLEQGYQLTDVLSKVSENGEMPGIDSLKYNQSDGAEAVNVLQPEVVWV
ncbi:uncharacterized protein LOC108915747 [Anoplophora glabripennis]|uniref:uncharacterized protein LOC108915747 n=1 Tax=Anoplophora glabripennis TaxID=217634 RepID=UPI0008747F4A|nr:uncharacterized protein LOC108915747 [Anoplophora glabripennis]